MSSILVLDDRPETITMLRLFLKHTGHAILGGATGAEGLQILEAGEIPVLIISDLLMPYMDGLTFLQHVRGNPDWAHIPFIMISAINDYAHRQECINAGVDAFLSKPFHVQDVQRVLVNLGILNPA